MAECRVFAPLLPVGSIIGVHDYDTPAVTPEEIKACVLGYVPIFEEYWREDVYDIQTCFWRKEV